MFDDFHQQMSKLSDDFRENYFKDRHVPSVLFQYTDVNGLKGILDSKRWRATHSSYLNDGKEITYADEMMSEILESRMTGLASDSLLFRIYDEVLGKRYGKPSVLKAWDNDIYLISFSQNGNLLDQWRAYAADGAGYAIGINPWKLKHKVEGAIILSHEQEGLGFVQVNYDLDEQKRLFFDLIEKTEQIFESEFNSLNDQERSQFPAIAARSLSIIIWQLALFYKHPAFQNEQEWRVVIRRWGRNVMRGINADAVERVLFRPTRNILVPYLELNFQSRDNSKLLPIEKIYLGPKHRTTNGKESLEMYLQSLGYVEMIPELVISDIPYQ
jgi:hypothetical protein